MAVISRPLPAMRICWSVAERFPAARFSSSRVRMHRAGRPSSIAKSDAMIEYLPTPPFDPNPPPM